MIDLPPCCSSKCTRQQGDGIPLCVTLIQSWQNIDIHAPITIHQGHIQQIKHIGSIIFFAFVSANICEKFCKCKNLRTLLWKNLHCFFAPQNDVQISAFLHCKILHIFLGQFCKLNVKLIFSTWKRLFLGIFFLNKSYMFGKLMHQPSILAIRKPFIAS